MTQADDTVPGGNPVAAVSFNYWKTHLGQMRAWWGRRCRSTGSHSRLWELSAPEFQSAVWGQVPDVFVPMSMLDVVTAGQG